MCDNINCNIFLVPKDVYKYLCWVCLSEQRAQRLNCISIHANTGTLCFSPIILRLICISIHADTVTLCFSPIILRRMNSSKLVVQTIVYLVEGRQMLQEYLSNRYDKIHYDSVCNICGQ